MWAHSCKRDESIRVDKGCGFIAANITRTLELMKGMKVDVVHSCKRDEGMGVH